MLISAIIFSMELHMIAGTASSQKVSHHKFLETFGKLVGTDTVIADTSLDACVYHCARNDSCLALTFNPDDAVCYLTSSNLILPQPYRETEAPSILFKDGILDSPKPYNYIRVELRSDLARGKESFLSSTFNHGAEPCLPPSCCNYAACNGNDGHYNDSILMAHSQHETEPWWLVDIGRVHTVYAVKFFNRLGIFGARSSNPTVKTGMSLLRAVDADDFELCYSIAGQIPAPVTLMPCISPRRARYVIFLISNTEITPINFLEIEVLGI